MLKTLHAYSGGTDTTSAVAAADPGGGSLQVRCGCVLAGCGWADQGTVRASLLTATSTVTTANATHTNRAAHSQTTHACLSYARRPQPTTDAAPEAKTTDPETASAEAVLLDAKVVRLLRLSHQVDRPLLQQVRRVRRRNDLPVQLLSG